MDPRDLSPDQLDAAAESLERQAQLLRELAKLRRSSLHERSPSATFHDDMTPDQVIGRGNAIARAAAARAGDVFLKAVSASKWGSSRNWVAHVKRDLGLDLSTGGLSNYRTGKREVPAQIARLAKEELGVPLSYWPPARR